MLSLTIQMKAIEHYVPVVSFTLMLKVVPTFEPVDDILTCDLFKRKLLTSTSLFMVRFIMLYKVV